MFSENNVDLALTITLDFLRSLSQSNLYVMNSLLTPSPVRVRNFDAALRYAHFSLPN